VLAASALLSARSFLAAFQRCWYPVTLRGESLRSEVLPAIVCLAFAIELGLKGLLVSSGVKKRGHDLAVLFEALPPEQRKEVMHLVGLPEPEFTKALMASRNTFDAWRYVHEISGEVEVSEQFMLAFANASIRLLAGRVEA
jgi:hypothetical protein